MGKVIDLKRFQSLKNSDVLVGIESIGPEVAAQWLRANRINRPVRNKHVEYLSKQMSSGAWQLNGQAIIIADTEDILDGQHRLMAVVDAGVRIRSMVVYGITREAFRTIDTGAVRTGSDALYVEFPGHQVQQVKAIGAAVPWCEKLERGHVSNNSKLANHEIIAYVQHHPSLWNCSEAILSFPKMSRPLSTGIGTALYEMFQRRDHDLAAQFISQLFTGELLKRKSPVYVLREMLIKDAQHKTKSYSASVRVRMAVKGWNCTRRGIDSVTHHHIAVNAKDDDIIKIL